jgi:hypothetical protein
MSDQSKCRCVFPSPTEQELATLPGEQPGTALRVHVECGWDGYVRLEQLAHDAGLGWYVQKSFTIPADTLAALIPELRKADCLIPRRRANGRRAAASTPFPLTAPPPMRLSHPSEPARRQA